jgi:uncharacterized protein
MEFLKVPRLGPKAFEQCAGFLRLASSDNPLDRSAVHPESYHVVETMASDLGVSVFELMAKPELRGNIKPNNYVTDKVGLPTLKDILSELDKPGRDPRETFQPVTFAEGLSELSDVKIGMLLPGVVTNVTAFGAFGDVGLHQNGLVHLSELADRYVTKASEVVSVGQAVSVRVKGVDPQRGRLELSMRSTDASNRRDYQERPKEDENKTEQRFQARPGTSQVGKTGQGSKGDRGSQPAKEKSQFNNPFANLKDLYKF